MIYAQVSCDSVKKIFGFTLVFISRKFLKEAEKCILRQIFGVFRIAAAVIDTITQYILIIFADETIECLIISSAHFFDQYVIGIHIFPTFDKVFVSRLNNFDRYSPNLVFNNNDESTQKDSPLLKKYFAG